MENHKLNGVGSMTELKAVESVWLAAAILTFEKYSEIENPSKEEMFFRQADIIKLASELHGSKVAEPLASTHAVGNSSAPQYNYLVGGKGENEKKRRISCKNEFNGKKERPDLPLEMIVKTNNGDKTVADIYDFVDNAYSQLFFSKDKEELLTTTRCKAILEYLDEYAGKSYMSPEKVNGEERNTFNKLKEAGGNAVSELDKMASLCEMQFGLRKFGSSRWLNGHNNEIRKYLWRQMKLPGHEDCLSSISLFAEVIGEDRARFRFSVELNDAQSDPKDYEQHHKILDRDIELGQGLVYVYGGNKDSHVITQINESTEEVKEKVANGTYEKVQVSFIITQNDIEEKYHDDKNILKAMLTAVNELMPYYKLVLGDEVSIPKTGKGRKKDMQFYKNIILYGPPGTGKTYNTVKYAVAIIDNEKIEELEKRPYNEVFKRYLELKKNGRIVFTTFHQSYGYEEFIEGIKPIIKDQDGNDSSDVKYKYADGIFKKFCNRAKQAKTSTLGIGENAKVWDVLLESTGLTELKKECFEKSYIKIGWPNVDENVTDETAGINSIEKSIILNFQEMEKGDIVFVQKNNTSIDAIGIIDGPCEFQKDDDEYPRTRKVKWIATGIDENVLELNKNVKLDRKSVYELKRMEIEDVIKLVEKYTKNEEADVEEKEHPYVFIIDEINRGNISKIFGELITLIETTKRTGQPEEATAILPYTGKEFGVPGNVYIIGTMNTADRSIALMDTALRRRFKFVEMMPKSSVIGQMNIHQIEGIDIPRLLDTINERIEYIFDREHTIGHAYFTPLAQNPSLRMLASIFENSIIPLLQEYFYEDYSKIQLVLGDNAKEDRYKFILDTDIKVKNIFKGNPDIDLPEKKYTIQLGAFYEAESYKQIYE